MKTLKYTRNWAYEDMFEVYFVDGSSQRCSGQTDNRGRIAWLEYDGVHYTPEQFDMLDIAYVHYMTPAKLEVKTPTKRLLNVYLLLGKAIGECQDPDKSVRMLARRENIVKEIRKRGFNLHDLMSEHKEA